MPSTTEKGKLSPKALADLRTVLQKEIGYENAINMDEEELNHIGNLLLALLSEGLKIRVTNPELFIKNVNNSGSIT